MAHWQGERGKKRCERDCTGPDGISVVVLCGIFPRLARRRERMRIRPARMLDSAYAEPMENFLEHSIISNTFGGLNKIRHNRN
jgi:hypothetical protein